MFLYPPLEMLMVHDLMSWYVVKGTEIKPTRHKFNWSCEIFPGREPDLSVVARLYSCERDEPPEYRWQDPASMCTALLRYSRPRLMYNDRRQARLLVGLGPLVYPSG